MTRLQRLFRIAWVFCRYRLDTFLPIAELPAPLKVFSCWRPGTCSRNRSSIVATAFGWRWRNWAPCS